MKRLLLILPLVMLVVAGCEPPGDSDKDAMKPPSKETEAAETHEQRKPVPPSPVMPPSLKRHPDRIYALEQLAKTNVRFGAQSIHAWIMDTEGKRNEGMMHLDPQDVPLDTGMLFVFQTQQPVANSFWMHDTKLPLDIIYIKADGTVINVGYGKPMNESQVKANEAYYYVLELRQGQAAKLGIKSGSHLTIDRSVKTME